MTDMPWRALAARPASRRMLRCSLALAEEILRLRASSVVVYPGPAASRSRIAAGAGRSAW